MTDCNALRREREQLLALRQRTLSKRAKYPPTSVEYARLTQIIMDIDERLARIEAILARDCGGRRAAPSAETARAAMDEAEGLNETQIAEKVSTQLGQNASENTDDHEEF